MADFAKRYLHDTDLFMPATREGTPISTHCRTAPPRVVAGAQTLDICTYESAADLFLLSRNPFWRSDYGRQILPSHYTDY